MHILFFSSVHVVNHAFYFDKPHGQMKSFLPGKEIVVLTGIPGSGKSTIAATKFHDHIRINLDTLKSRPKEKLAIIDALESGQSVVIDSTNTTRKVRARYVEIARACGVRIRSVFVKSPIDVALSNNRQRLGPERVPDYVVRIYNAKLEPPSVEEGFESCEVVEAMERTAKEI